MDNSLDAKKINENINEQRAVSTGASSSTTYSANIQMAGSVLPGFRNQLWNNVENVLDLIYVKSCELMQLQKVLCKKRDPSVGSTFAELLNETDDGDSPKMQILAYFWPETMKVMKNSLVKASNSSSSTRQTFEGEFPKLARLLNDLWQRLCASANTCLTSDPSITLPNPFHVGSSGDIREILTEFER